MAATTTFLVPVDPRKIAIGSVTSEASGHPVELAFDRNLNTHWEPTDTATNSIAIDLGEALPIDTLALFVRNYNTNFGEYGPEVCYVEYSDTGTSGPWTITSMSYTFDGTQEIGKPLIIGPTLSSPITHRYWRIRFYNMGYVIQLAQVFLCASQLVSVPNSRDESDLRMFAHQSVAGPGGRAHRAPVNTLPIFERRRTWLITDSDDLAALQAVFDDCGGREALFIHAPSDADAEVCEARDKRFSEGRQLYGVWRPSVTFRTWPYIEDGEAS